LDYKGILGYFPEQALLAQGKHAKCASGQAWEYVRKTDFPVVEIE